MKLIFIHGPPAAGKYTIAQCLVRLVGARNFHNHLTIDVARALFDFGSDDFWNLSDRLRLVALEEIAASSDAIVAMTAGYTGDDAPMVEAMREVVATAGGEFVPVFLECDLDELKRRVIDAGRGEMNKINSVNGLERYLDEWDHIPVPGPECLTVVTTGRLADDCAEEIVRRIGLLKTGRVQGMTDAMRRRDLST